MVRNIVKEHNKFITSTEKKKKLERVSIPVRVLSFLFVSSVDTQVVNSLRKKVI